MIKTVELMKTLKEEVYTSPKFGEAVKASLAQMQAEQEAAKAKVIYESSKSDAPFVVPADEDK